MPPCKNDPSRRFVGDEPSPKGRGFCAGPLAVGTRMRGADGRAWVVRADKNGRPAWRRDASPASSASSAPRTGDATFDLRTFRFGDGRSLSWDVRAARPEVFDPDADDDGATPLTPARARARLVLGGHPVDSVVVRLGEAHDELVAAFGDDADARVDAARPTLGDLVAAVRRRYAARLSRARQTDVWRAYGRRFRVASFAKFAATVRRASDLAGDRAFLAGFVVRDARPWFAPARALARGVGACRGDPPTAVACRLDVELVPVFDS